MTVLTFVLVRSKELVENNPQPMQRPNRTRKGFGAFGLIGELLLGTVPWPPTFCHRKHIDSSTNIATVSSRQGE
jgi:hypothetical protein